MSPHDFRRIALAHELLVPRAREPSEPLDRAIAQREPDRDEPDRTAIRGERGRIG